MESHKLKLIQAICSLQDFNNVNEPFVFPLKS